MEKYITDEERAFVRRRYEEGAPTSVIAWELDFTTQRVNRALRRMNLPHRFISPFHRRATAKKTIKRITLTERRALGFITRDKLHSNKDLGDAMDMPDNKAGQLYLKLRDAGLISMRSASGKGRPREVRVLAPADLAMAAVGDKAADIAPSTAKRRKCLKCTKRFDSRWNGERICRRCKDTQAWSEPILRQEGAKCHAPGFRG